MNCGVDGRAEDGINYRNTTWLQSAIDVAANGLQVDCEWPATLEHVHVHVHLNTQQIAALSVS